MRAVARAFAPAVMAHMLLLCDVRVAHEQNSRYRAPYAKCATRILHNSFLYEF